MEKFDVRINDTIVCYDSVNMYAAPRASWMLRAFGAKNVLVLDGAYQKWAANPQFPDEYWQQKDEAFTRKGNRNPPNDEERNDIYNYCLNKNMV